MEGRYTEKLEQKQATSLEVIDAQKSLDGRDRQIEVTHDEAVSAQTTADAALDRANKAHAFEAPVAGAGPAGTGNAALSFAYETARKAHIRSDNGALGNVALDVVGDIAEYALFRANKAQILDTAHTVEQFNDGNWSLYLVWKYADAANGNAVNAGQAAARAQNRADQAYNVGDHSHPYASKTHTHKYAEITGAPNIPNITAAAAGPGSHKHGISLTPFINYPAEHRRAMLSLRSEVRSVAAKTKNEEVKTLAEAVETAFKLQMDYAGFDAFEREERFRDPAWSKWSEDYRRVFGVDEYAEEDRKNYMGYGPVRMDPYEGIAKV